MTPTDKRETADNIPRNRAASRSVCTLRLACALNSLVSPSGRANERKKRRADYGSIR